METPPALSLLMARSRHVEVRRHGNVRSAAAFLYGLAAEELDASELAADDPDFHLLITVRAVRRDG